MLKHEMRRLTAYHEGDLLAKDKIQNVITKATIIVCVCACPHKDYRYGTSRLSTYTRMDTHMLLQSHTHTPSFSAKPVQTRRLSQGKYQCLVLSSHSDKRN